MLHDYEDASICDFLEFGFPLGYFGDVQRGSPDSYTFVRNHGGAKHFPVQIQEYLSKEKSYGAILGPFKENPFCCNIMLSPLNSVPKKDTIERRFILDLSFPKGQSINDSVSKDFYLGQKISLSYPNVDDLVNIIKLKGKGCLLFKRDLRRFYRQIGIDIGDASVVGYSFNGFIYFDKVLSMGLKSAAFIAQRVTNAVKYICQILNISIENYLDDLAGGDYPDKAWFSYLELAKVLEFCGLEESVHKACPPATRMVFIGVLFDTETLTLLVTQERLQEIKLLVKSWLEFESATVKQLQSLIGKLNFVAHCVKPSRIFISRLLNWLRIIQNSDKNEIIPVEIKKDLQWWYIFLPRFNGVAMMDLDEWSEPDQLAASDACLSGCGSFSQGKFFHAAFPDFILTQTLHINCLELLSIMVTVKIWGKYWKGKKIVLFCDNKNSCRALNTGITRNSFMQACLREIFFFASIWEFQIRGREIAGRENRIPDFLSRWEENPKYSELFYSSVADLNFELSEYLVTEDLFRFSHDW